VEAFVRIGPAPLIPAYPVEPDRQQVYPRALGQAYVGTPRLNLPEVKAKAVVNPAAQKTSGLPLEAQAPQAFGAQPTTSRPSTKDRTAPGALLDVKA
jgi:hypothetical protein